MGHSKPPITPSGMEPPAPPKNEQSPLEGAEKFGNADKKINQLVWETTGGGEIRFSATPVGDAYQIHVYKFGPFLTFDLKLTSVGERPFAR